MTGSEELTATEGTVAETGIAGKALEQATEVAVEVAEEKIGVEEGVVVVIGRPMGIDGEINPNLGKPGGGWKLEVPVNREGAAAESPVLTAGRVLLDTVTEDKYG